MKALLIALIWAAFFMPVPASGQQAPCTDRQTFIRHLQSKWHETPIAMGLTARGGLIEVLVSKDGGTWTMIVTMPNGMTCGVATGTSWEKVKPTRPDNRPDA